VPKPMPESASAEPTAQSIESAHLLDGLLRQSGATPVDAKAAAGASGHIVLGTLSVLPSPQRAGQAQVPGMGVVALGHSLVPLTAAQLGSTVALSLMVNGDNTSALLLGCVWQGAAQPSEALTLTVDGHREVIEAAHELELRCGEAAIVLTADGRIQLRGTYITSHASATQRIVGASVHVN
jgi:hypothetical protein